MKLISFPDNKSVKGILNKHYFLNLTIIIFFSIIAFCLKNEVFLLFSLIGVIIINLIFSYLVPKNCLVDSRNIAILIFFLATLYLLLIMWYYPTLHGAPYIKGGSDDLIYEQNAQICFTAKEEFVNANDVSLTIRTAHPGYTVLLSNLIFIANKIGEYHTILPRLINMLCVALISGMLYILCIYIGLNKKISYITALLFGVYPVVLFYSSFILRDTIIAFCTLITIVGYLLLRSKKVKNIFLGTLLLCISLLVASYLRIYQAPVIISILFIAYILKKIDYKIIFRFTLSMVLVASLVLIISYQKNIIHSYRAIVGTILRDKMLLNIKCMSHAERQNSELSRFVFNQPFPYYIPSQIFYSLLTPLPILCKDLTRCHISLGTLLWLLNLPALFIGTFLAWKNIELRWLVILFWAVYIGIAITSFKTRQLIQIYPYGFILMALGWQFKKKKVFFLTLKWALVCACLGIVYLYLKI